MQTDQLLVKTSMPMFDVVGSCGDALGQTFAGLGARVVESGVCVGLVLVV